MAPKQNILIVDDFETARIFLKETLENLGFDAIYEAKQVSDAVKVLETQKSQGAPITLIFADWCLPGETGLDLLKHIRDNEGSENVKYIMVTSQREKENVAAAMKAGCDLYIKKPFTESNIKESLVELNLLN